MSVIKIVILVVLMTERHISIPKLFSTRNGFGGLKSVVPPTLEVKAIRSKLPTLLRRRRLAVSLELSDDDKLIRRQRSVCAKL